MEIAKIFFQQLRAGGERIMMCFAKKKTFAFQPVIFTADHFFSKNTEHKFFRF